MGSITSRRALIFGVPCWQQAITKNLYGPIAKLLSLACSIPRGLQRLDLLTSSRRSDEDVVSLLTELIKLESQLQAWLLAWYRSEGSDASPFRTDSITQYADFVGLHGTAAGSFPQVFTFPDSPSAVGHSLYWSPLLVLREAILDAANLLRGSEIDYLERSRLATAVGECADAICQTVPFLTSKQPTPVNERVVCGHLQFAVHWYKRQKDKYKAEWCEMVTARLSRRIAAQRYCEPPEQEQSYAQQPTEDGASGNRPRISHGQVSRGVKAAGRLDTAFGVHSTRFSCYTRPPGIR